MSARGVTREVHFRRIAAIAQNIPVDPAGGGARLADDVRDSYARTEVILDKDDRCAAFGEYGDEVAVVFFAAAAPIAAVNIDQHRATRLICGVDVELLTRRTAVRHAQPRFSALAHPARLFGALLSQLRILRHGFARIILVFHFLLAKS